MKSKNIFVKVGLYYFITYLFTGILFVIGNNIENYYQYIDLPMYGPTFGAIIMVLLERENLSKFFKERFAFKGDTMCYVSLIIPVFIIGGLSFFSSVYWHLNSIIEVTSIPMLVIMIVHKLFDAAGEEVGWRGYLLPTLQKKFTPLVSALILSIFWEFWHVPVLLRGVEYFLIHSVSIVSVSIIITIYYNRASKSIVPAILMHYMLNIPVALILICAFEIKVFILMSLCYLVWAVILTILNWKELTDKSKIEKNITI